MSETGLGIDEIDRKYEVLEKMGEGGMGAIFKVRHLLLEEVRVVKVIRAHLRGQEDHQARFLREAKVATQLRHPGIAQTYDFGIGEDGSAYIVMEFIDGTDLAEVLGAGRRLTQPEALAVADQMLLILSYLHDKKIVHRDISPDNIMLTQDEQGRLQVKLIDLGIAKPLEASQQFTQTGMFIGKLKYASPEQLGSSESKKVGTRSDLYSFGLVLYQLLTGEFPISGEDEATILAGHLLRPPRSFEETDPDKKVSPALRSAVLKVLEKSADDRYASAEEFRRTLARAAIGAEPEDDVESTLILDTPIAGGGSLAAQPAAERTVLTRAREGPARPHWARRKGWLAAAVVAVVAIGGTALWRSGLPGRLLSGADLVGSGRPRPEDSRAGPGEGPAEGLSALDFGTYHALVIGNNQYRQLPRLESAVLDAEELAGLLERQYGFQVKLLTDATRHQILSTLAEVTESLSARDNLLLYYAGHGWLDDKNQSGYWQPVDAEPFNTANWISTKHEVSAILDRTPARQVLVVADSCYAGALAEMALPPPGPPPAGPQHLALVRQLLSRRARLALTSGGLSPVLDQGDGRHSIFSKALLDTLGSNAGIVEISRLFGDIRSQVTQAASRFGVEQDPRLAPIAQAGDEGGEFFFVPSPSGG